MQGAHPSVVHPTVTREVRLPRPWPRRANFSLATTGVAVQSSPAVGEAVLSVTRAARRLTDVTDVAEAALALLPPVCVYEAAFVATSAQTVPPLVTTAFRGALLRSLKDIVCLAPARSSCRGCAHAERCAYPPLVEPRDEAAREVPAPLVLRPVDAVTSAEPRRLERGQLLRIRLAFVGDAGREHVALVKAALAGVARRGLGFKPKPRARRPSLDFAAFTRLEPGARGGSSWVLHFDTPCRLTVGGRTAPAPGAQPLWDAVVRRVRMLSRLYGGGAPALPAKPPWTMEDAATHVVSIRRFSERQRKAMTWEGFVGRARLRLTGDARLAARLLAFVEDVQLGKGTQFGFGAIRCTGVDE